MSRLTDTLIAVLLLAVVIAGVWEVRKIYFTPATPPAPSQVQPVAPVIPKVSPVPVQPPPSPKASQPKSAPKKVLAPTTSPTSHPSNPTIPVTHPSAPVPPRPAVPYIPRVYLPPPPPSEWKGNNDSAIKHPGQIVVKNETQWNHFWAEHHPEEVSPDVDFSKNMVVGVFLGLRPADSFAAEITGARTTANALIVDYTEHVPPPGTFQVAVEVYPYDIKVIPHSSMAVQFNKLAAQYQKPAPVARVAVSSPTPVATSTGTK